MDQEIIRAFKRHYRSLMLKDILVVVSPPTEGVSDTRGEQSVQTWKNYNMYEYNVACNVKKAWDMVSA